MASETLKPQYFISRPEGVLVPLVAVDELPPSVAIHNVPRGLSQAQTLGMTSLGVQSSRGQSYLMTLGPQIEGLAQHESFGPRLTEDDHLFAAGRQYRHAGQQMKMLADRSFKLGSGKTEATQEAAKPETNMSKWRQDPDRDQQTQVCPLSLYSMSRYD